MSTELEIIVARIDERTKQLAASIDEIKHSLQNKYVTRSEFAPVRAISFGLVTAICVAVVGAMITLVIR